MGVILETSFKPAWWLNNPHLQTLWPTFTRRLPPPPRRVQILETPDGDFLELAWCGEGAGPLVLLLHGLAGSFNSHYIKGQQWALLQMGWRSVAMNFRGCGKTPNRTARCYHSGETDDVDFVYRHLLHLEPGAPKAAVGFSLGGNVLLKWLGERKKTIDLFAACAVSVPLQLHLCADTMDRGFSRIYRNRLIGELKQYIAQKIRYLEKKGFHAEAKRLKALGELDSIRSFWEYDDRVIAGLYPFEDVHDYYRQCSSRRFLGDIQVPTLLIQSLDDPFMIPDVIPPPEETSPSFAMEITAGGGHVGFIQGTVPGKGYYWLEQRIPQFLRSRYLAKHASAEPSQANELCPEISP